MYKKKLSTSINLSNIPYFEPQIDCQAIFMFFFFLMACFRDCPSINFLFYNLYVLITLQSRLQLVHNLNRRLMSSKSKVLNHGPKWNSHGPKWLHTVREHHWVTVEKTEIIREKEGAHLVETNLCGLLMNQEGEGSGVVREIWSVKLRLFQQK